MNYSIFERQLHKAHEESNCIFTYEECSSIFEEYFKSYKKYTGKDHPPLRTSKLVEILNIVDYNGLFDAECYPILIQSYFSTYFPNSDRNICHFFSGRVREMRFFELLL